MNLLETGFIRRIRQNHALEHATITLLMGRDPSLQLVGGRSTHRGFYVYGPVDEVTLKAVAQEALARLQGGESSLAIHPNCGTNLVTAGTLAGLAALTTTAIGRRNRASLLDQIPAAILAATAGLLLGRPIGLRLQKRVTTLADVQDLEIGEITPHRVRQWTLHFVTVDRRM